jgi:tetratricopeptide (TPR) repeat protein
MKLTITRMAILLAFGFIYACSSPNHLQQAEQHKNNERYQAALEAVDRSINQQPDNPEAHLAKAQILGSLTRLVPPAERMGYYAELAASLDKTTEHATRQQRNDLLDEARSLRNQIFQSEYESAANYLSGFENNQPGNLLLPALPHLENANIIEPDNTNVIQSLVQVYTLNGYYNDAIIILMEANRGEWEPEQRSETLGFLFYSKGDYENAILHLSDAWLNGRGSANAGRGLVNAYNKSGDYNSEREILEQLVEIEPDNIYHHTALAKIVANQVLADIRYLTAPTGEVDLSEQLNEAIENSNEAEATFERAFQIDENHILANLSAGMFFRNFGFLLNEARQLHPELIAAEIVEDNLYKSLNYLERASELDPEQPLVWNAIWEVYEFLGMTEQAGYARERSREL